jgi:hypothetical protein
MSNADYSSELMEFICAYMFHSWNFLTKIKFRIARVGQ